MPPPIIRAQEAFSLFQKNPAAKLIDVRTPKEFEALHATGAVLQPIDQLSEHTILQLTNNDKNAPLFILCQSGVRASRGTKTLLNMGFTNVHCVEGGIMAWEAAGLPIQKKTKKCFSVERQVRVTIGTFVLLGLVLGHWVHPGFLLLAGFMGFGLIVAGLTDTCGLGIVLAHMPWNKNQKNSCACVMPKQ